MNIKKRIQTRFSILTSALAVMVFFSGCAGAASATAAPTIPPSTVANKPKAPMTTPMIAPSDTHPAGSTSTRTWITTATPAMADAFAPSLPAFALGRLGKGEVMGMDISPDERHLAIASGIGIYLYETNSADGTLKEIWFKATTREAISVAFSPDGRLLAAGLQGIVMGDDYCQPVGGAGGILLMETDSGDVIRTLDGPVGLSPIKLVFAPDSKTVGFIDSSGGGDSGFLWNINDSKPQLIPRVQEEYLETMQGLAFSPDGNQLAYGFYKNTNPPEAGTEIRVLDRKTQQPLFQFGTFDSDLRAITYSPDSRQLAAGDSKGQIRVWDMQTGEQVASAAVPDITQLHFSADNRRLFIRTDKRVLLWDLHGNQAVWSLVTHSRGITVSADGRRLLSYDENALTIWNGEDGKEIRDYLLSGHEALYDPVVSADGREIITDTNLGNIMVWDASTRQLRRVFNVGSGRFDYAVASDNRTLAVNRGDSIQIWDYAQGKPVRILPIPGEAIQRMAYAPDGGALAVASQGSIRVLDVLTGHTLMHQPGNPGLAFSPDGKLLAFISSDSTRIILWNIDPGRIAGELNYKWAQRSSDLVFSPNGQRLGVAGFGPGVNWWSITDPEPRPTPGVDNSWPLLSMAFSPDGTTGAISSHDILIWELSSGRQLRALSGPTCWSTRVVYSPDGGMLASGSDDGTILLWDMAAVLKGS